MKVMEVKKDSYIVVIKNKLIGTDCAKDNYIFKQRMDNYYISPCVDLKGGFNNGNTNLRFDCDDQLKEWRYAKPDEIEAYEAFGRPIDVTDLTNQYYEIY